VIDIRITSFTGIVCKFSKKNSFQKLKKEIQCILELKLRIFTGRQLYRLCKMATEITVNVLILNLFADPLDI